MTTSLHRNTLICLPLLLLPQKPCNKLTYQDYPRVVKRSVPPTHHSHTAPQSRCHMRSPQCSTGRYFGGSWEGASRGDGEGETYEVTEPLPPPFKRNHSALFISESRGSWQSVTAAQHNMWWRVCSLLAWFPLQGKELELRVVWCSVNLMFLANLPTCESRLSRRTDYRSNPGKSATFHAPLKSHIWGMLLDFFNPLFSCWRVQKGLEYVSLWDMCYGKM